MKVSYRLATIDDISILVNCRIALLQEASKKQQDKKLTIAVRKKITVYLKRAIPAEEYISYLAIVNENVVGIAGIVIRARPASFKCPTGAEGYVLDMYILPGYRKQGIGKQLLKKILAVTKKKKLSKLTLHATEEGEHLYRKFGFKEPVTKVLEKIILS